MSTYQEYIKRVNPCACVWEYRTSNGTTSEGNFFTNEADYKIQYIWDGSDDSYSRIIDFDTPKNKWGVMVFRLDTSNLPENARPYTYSIYHKVSYGMVANSDYHSGPSLYNFAPTFAEASKTKPTATFTGNRFNYQSIDTSSKWEIYRDSNNAGTTHVGFTLLCNTNIDTYRRFYTLYAAVTYRVYTFSVVVTAGAGGTATGTGNYEDLSQYTIRAVPDAGYRFVSWSDGSTSAVRTITATQDIGYTAYFEKLSYSVHVYSEDLSKGTVTGSGTYEYGTVVTISAQAKDGYRFKKWSDDSLSSVRTITVTGDIHITAYFEIAVPVIHSIELIPNPANTGQGFLISVTVT